MVEGEARDARPIAYHRFGSSRLPDPIAKAIGGLVDYIEKLEKRVDELSERRADLRKRRRREQGLERGQATAAKYGELNQLNTLEPFKQFKRSSRKKKIALVFEFIKKKKIVVAMSGGVDSS